MKKIDERMTSITNNMESMKVDSLKSLKGEEEARRRVEERVNNMQTNVRELYEKLNQVLPLREFFIAKPPQS